MKTRKQQLSEMVEALADGQLRNEIVLEYKIFLASKDEKLKENAEFKKELSATKFEINKSIELIGWLNKQLILCE